ncbi:SDR family NAD(P)-dependent oxidoreductase [Nocardia sp. NBC_01388]|uniref:SDR family NAD(P)-dependent oxidoreductase n=1 Tax=Nocardia sp. NBC_01388 TaxID=2903596 RepID=UPI003245351B
MALAEQIAAVGQVRSRFGPASTALDVVAGVDLSGRTAVITGGHAGMGLEATRAMVQAGARVIIASRSPERAAQSLHAAGVQSGTEVLETDLADLDSIRKAVSDLRGKPVELDYIIANAGVFDLELRRTPNGWEEQFAVNHLGHFALIAGLYPGVRPGARIVIVSSASHIASDIHWDDIDNTDRPYDPAIAYGQSKTANALHAVALDQLGSSTGIRAFAVHPGYVPGTGLSPQLHEPGSDRAKTVPQGAATVVWAATAPELDQRGGIYLEDCAVAAVSHSTAFPRGLQDYLDAGVRPHALDSVSAQRLWSLSARRTGTDVPRG